MRAPRCVGIVESFVGGSDRLLTRVGDSSLVKTCQVGKPVVAGGRHHPGVAALGEVSREAVIVLEDQRRLRAHLRQGCVPADGGIRKVDIELSDHRLAIELHVSGRREVGLLDILQIVHQRLLRRTSLA